MNPRTLTALFAAVLTLAGVLPAPPLLDAETDAMIRRDIAHEIRRRGGAERVMIMDYPNEEFILAAWQSHHLAPRWRANLGAVS